MDNTEKYSDKSGEKPKKKITSRQVAAIVGVILLALLYLVTFLASIFDRTDSGRLFMACMAATLIVPFLIWLYSWIYSRAAGKRTIGDPEPPAAPKKDDETPAS